MNGKSGVEENVLTALPKGGGANRGIEDAFETRLNTGSFAYRIPIVLPPGRLEGEVDLALVYDSIAQGNSPLGVGWSVPVLSIRHRTDTGLPRYDASDSFVLSTGEQLVAVGGDRYRTRVEQAFRMITFQGDHWELVETDGTRLLLGATPGARLHSPDDPNQMFQWFVSRQEDPNGNVVEYDYSKDNVWKRYPEGRTANQVYLREIRYTNTDDGRFLNVVRFLYDFILEGQQRPDAWVSYLSGFPVQTNWRCRGIAAFTTDLDNDQDVSVDFSTGVAGPATLEDFLPYGLLAFPAQRGSLVYENLNNHTGLTVNGYQPLAVELPIPLKGPTLTLYVEQPGDYQIQIEDQDGNQTQITIQAANAGEQRMALAAGNISVRRFAIETEGRPWVLKSLQYAGDGPHPVLFTRYELDYAPTVLETANPNPGAVPPSVSQLQSITRVGYDDQLNEDRLPAIAMEYSRLNLRDIWPRPLNGSPNESLRDPDTTLISFTGNARVDILQTQTGHRCYLNGGTNGGGVDFLGRDLVESPTIQLSDFDAMLRDVEGLGAVDLSTTTAYYRNPATASSPLDTSALRWGDFKQFDPAQPHPVLSSAEMPLTRSIDFNGDGNIDLLKTGADFVAWRNRGDQTWSSAQIQPRRHSFGNRDFPDISLADPGVFIADMNGDGLDEIVRVADRKVDYWSQVDGQWQFKSTMRASPRIPDFNPRRVLVRDITNDGFADLVYIHAGRVAVYLNCGGQRYSPEFSVDLTDRGISRGVRIPSDTDSLELADLNGDGVKGILWSFERVGTENNYYYMPLTAGVKPNLLTAVDNGLGGRIEIDYSTSAVEAAQAERQGQPWRSHVPFPVLLVKRIRKIDQITGNTELAEMVYRNGYYDRRERRFRGFDEVTEILAGDATVRGTRIIHYFHNQDFGPLNGADLARARALSGREYCIVHRDLATGDLLRDLHTVWGALPVHTWNQNADGDFVSGPALNQGDPTNQVYFVFPQHELTATYEGTQQPKYSLVSRRYDSEQDPQVPVEFGNLREETDYGEVAVQSNAPALVTINVDGAPVAFQNVNTPEQKRTRYHYALNRAAHIVRHVCVEETWTGPAFDQLVAEVRTYYDGGAQRDDHLPLYRIEQGNVQRRERLFVHTDTVNSLFEASFLPRLGANPDQGPGHFLRTQAADGRPALFAVEERNVFLRDGGQIKYGLLLERYSPRGAVTRISYDSEHWMVREEENVLGHKTSTEQHSYRTGFPQQIKDKNGVVSRNVYDAFGRVVDFFPDVDAGTPAAESYTYLTDVQRAGPNQLLPVCFEERRLIDENEATVRHVRTLTYFDGFGKVLQVRRSAATQNTFTVRSYAFNTRRLLLYESLPYHEQGANYQPPNFQDLPATSHTYDGLERGLTIQAPDGSQERYRYMPWTVEYFDQEDTQPASPHKGTSRRFLYDARRQLVRLEETLRYAPDNENLTIHTQYERDVFGNLVKRTDPDGIETELRHTPTGLALYRNHPDAGESLSFYDAEGNLIYQRDARGQVLCMAYDEENRILREIPQDDFNGQSDVDYNYDDPAALSVGRLRSVDDKAEQHTVSFEYDGQGNVTRVTRDIAGVQAVTSSYYNNMGLLRRRDYDTGDVLIQTYGADGRVRSLSYQLTGPNVRKDTINRIDYHPSGQIERLEYFAGTVVAQRDYDLLTQRLVRIQTIGAGGATLQDLRYTDYDLAGNLRAIRDETDAENTNLYLYTYDSLYRLRRAQYQSAGAGGYDFTYRYHPNGRLRVNDEFVVGEEIVYNPLNQPNAARGIAAQPALFDYDAAGNMIQNRGLQSLSWDVRGQLRETLDTTGERREIYWYAYDGRRIRKRLESQGAQSTETRYFEPDHERTDAQDRLYWRVGDLSLGRFDANGQGLVFLLDHLGSVVGAVDEGGTTVNTFSELYSPYGQSPQPAGAADKRFHFSGKERDASGLHYFGDRYYDPDLGSWTAVDLAGQYHTPYLYTGGNPVNFYDPDGSDAVAIVFPDYRVGALGTRWRHLGHAGILLIDNRTGLTKYYEYGRYNTSRGRVKYRPYKVKVKDGRPTKRSLERVLRRVSRKSGQSGRIEGVYIRNDKFKEMNKYARERLKANRNPDREPYSKWTNNCGHFVTKTIEAGDVDTPTIIDPRPNSIAGELRDEFQTLDYSRREGLRLGTANQEQDQEQD